MHKPSKPKKAEKAKKAVRDSIVTVLPFTAVC